MPSLRIATRKSPLALWQSEHVAERLRLAHPGLRVELVPMSTRGDEVLDRSLAAIGGKGLFLKELELAMQRGEADCAVHSLKDVPMELEPGFTLPAILARADYADAFVSSRHADIAALPQGARVGTSSLRRQAQLRARRPDLQLLDLRGNVNTRLQKLDDGGYEAIVLACAGLERLGLGPRIRARLQAPDWLPAPSQGAIAIECRDDDGVVQGLCSALDDASTRICVDAERAMNRALHGSCHVPVAAYARLDGDKLHLAGLVGDAADGRCVRAEATGQRDAPAALGRDVAAQLLALGAREMLLVAAEADTGPYLS
ncbi:hydroxymethylbilane synthase [Cognatiluteimonas profundi]|uniref:hydroxymethylbilane synthase n=1 Tax=Cognatiluteimonas profundi TaxID=2594501 RepID=UPI00131E7AB3|nr:hydroxymethylbilane synthase [Lysobacter profundi]